jgi:hypothetical protein
MKIKELFVQSVFVSASVDSVREGAVAAGLTALMILLFLGSWREKLSLIKAAGPLLEGDDHAGLRYAAAPTDSCTPAALSSVRAAAMADCIVCGSLRISAAA